MLAALGLDTAKTGIKSFDEKSVLIVERFDWRWTSNGRLLHLPLEDCCQAFSVPPSRKHQTDGRPRIEQILQLLWGSDESLAYQQHILKADIVFWLLCATNGHAKDFSLFLHPGGRFQLAPLHDAFQARPSVDSKQLPWKHFCLVMSFGDKPRYEMRQVARFGSRRASPNRGTRRNMSHLHPARRTQPSASPHQAIGDGYPFPLIGSSGTKSAPV